MNKLTCNEVNCVNNMGGFCTARVIHINGILADESVDTDCGTYGEKITTKALKNITNVNLGGAISQGLNMNSVEISPSIVCDAVKCIYNTGKRGCSAKNVLVNTDILIPSGSPYCETFRETEAKGHR